MVLVAPQGFEPRLIGSEPTVLPLNEGATDAAGAAGDDRWLPFRVYEVGEIRSTCGCWISRRLRCELECSDGQVGEQDFKRFSGCFVSQAGANDRVS